MTPPEPEPAPEPQPPAAATASSSSPAPEESDLTWEDKEDKLDAENIQPDTPADKKYQYKEGGRLNGVILRLPSKDVLFNLIRGFRGKRY